MYLFTTTKKIEHMTSTPTPTPPLLSPLTLVSVVDTAIATAITTTAALIELHIRFMHMYCEQANEQTHNTQWKKEVNAFCYGF